MFRQSTHQEWVLPSHYVGAHTVNKLYKIPSWTDAPFTNFPIKVKIQRYRCLKLDILGFIFRQSALEEWVLPSLHVWPHSLGKFTLFQVGLTIQLAIFLSKYKYKNTDVWNLSYWVYVSAIGSWRMSFDKQILWSSNRNKYIKKFKVELTLHLAIFPLKSKCKDTNVWNLTYWVLCFGNRLLKNEFCQVLMFDFIVFENLQYFKLDWRSN